MEARQNSQLGLIASPWAGEPGELPFPSGRFQACGDVALDTVGPAMKGPILRVNMDGSFYRFMGASGFAIGSPQELFIKR